MNDLRRFGQQVSGSCLHGAVKAGLPLARTQAGNVSCSDALSVVRAPIQAMPPPTSATASIHAERVRVRTAMTAA
jgi:hypothetical protein